MDYGLERKPRIILFTFRTFPVELLNSHLPNTKVHVLGKLKDDLSEMKSKFPGNNVIFIGFALSNTTRQEPVAINKFNKGKIDAHGPDVVTLKTFASSSLKNADSPTWSFCNYAAYVLAQQADTHLIHVTREDFPDIVSLIRDVAMRP